MNEIAAEIDEMIGDIKKPEEDLVEETVEEDTGDESDPEPVDESEEREEADEEVKVGEEEEPTEELPVSEKEEEVVEEEEAPKPDEELEEETEEEIPDEVAVMRDHINTLSGLLLQKGIQIPGMEAEVPAGEKETGEIVETVPAVAAPAQELSLADLVILEEGADFDAIMENPETFATYQRGLLGRYGSILQQEVLRNIPTIVAHQVRQVSALTTAIDAFYKENEDLMAVKPTVGAIADRIVAEHPEYTLDKLMEESATVARRVLKLPAPGEKKPVRKKTNPSFIKPKGSKQRALKPKVSALQSDIDEMLE